MALKYVLEKINSLFLLFFHSDNKLDPYECSKRVDSIEMYLSV